MGFRGHKGDAHGWIILNPAVTIKQRVSRGTAMERPRFPPYSHGMGLDPCLQIGLGGVGLSITFIAVVPIKV